MVKESIYDLQIRKKKTEFYTSYRTKHDAVKINATYLKLNQWPIYTSELHYPPSTYNF